MTGTGEPPRTPFPPLKGHRMLQALGEGGMGAVYLAEDEALGRRVAVKLISDRVAGQGEARARFLREARAMATVEHPHIVRAYSFGESEGTAYFIMEYVEGETLADRVKRTGPLSVGEALRIVRQVVEALEAAWEKRVVHRDIKPSNILLDRHSQVHVADFGLAKTLSLAGDASLTESGSILGTPHYVSPEQARGHDLDFRSDLYSLGVVLFEMLTARRPFEGTTPFDVVAKHLHEPFPELLAWRPDAPAALGDLLRALTRKDPAERPQSFEDLRAQLDALIAGTPVTPRTPARAPALAPATPGTHPRALPTPTAVPAATVAADATDATDTATKRRVFLAGLIPLLSFVALVAYAFYRESTHVHEHAAAEKRLVVAVTPFYGPDPDSANEGRVMAALVERAIAQRLPASDVKVLGVEDTKVALRDHAAARALGERLGATVVIWGEAFVLRGESEVQPYFTMVPAKSTTRRGVARSNRAGNPFDPAGERAGGSLVLGGQAANQIDLRKTGAAGVSDLVMILAGTHALYRESKPEKALALFRQAPRSAESLRYQAEALQALNRGSEALAALTEAVAVDPKDAQAWASLGDRQMAEGARAEAVAAYTRAAEAGGPYTTRRGLVQDGRLYVKETTLHKSVTKGKEDDTGYLLALDPATGRVQERWLLPGEVTSLRPHARAIEIDTLSSPDQPTPATMVLANGHLDRPVFGRGLRLRRQSVNGGKALAANFNEKPDFAFDEKDPAAPRTLVDLEAALRQAIERDPTQPWHRVLLGEALWFQGRKGDAPAEWERVFAAGAYPAIPFDDFAYMASMFEDLGQGDWADRAYAEALKRRRANPQAIEATTLIERLISAPFLRTKDGTPPRTPERAHLWLARARELTGITEADELAAEHWRRWYASAGQAAQATEEEAFERRVVDHPANFTSRLVRFDYAITLFMSVTLGLWLYVLALLAAPAAPTDGTVRFGLARRVASVTLAERRVLLAGWLACMIAAIPVVVASAHVDGATSIPLPSMMDSYAGGASLAVLDDLVETRGTVEARYAAAVAHHMAGDGARARELYQGLEDDERAQKNLKALDEGNLVPPERLTAEQYLAAVVARSWTGDSDHGGGINYATNPGLVLTYFDRSFDFITAALRSTALAGLLLLPPFLLIPPVRTEADPRPAPGRLGRITRYVIPGAADLARGKAVRAFAAMVLFGAVAYVAIVKATSAGSTYGPGLLSSSGTPAIERSYPMPPGAEEHPSAKVFVYQYAGLFWTCLALAAVGCVVLHATALRAGAMASAPAATPVAPLEDETLVR